MVHRLRGFTLLELLVVTGIMAMVAGLSLSFLSRVGRSLAVTAFRGQVVSTLRAARNTAIGETAPVWVAVDPEGGNICAVSRRTAGMWHFEPGREGEGGFGLGLSLRGAWEPVPGKIGGAVRLRRGGYGDAGAGGEFDFAEGGAIEAWVYPEVPTGSGVVISKGKAYRLAVDGSGTVYGEFGLGAKESVKSPFPIPFGRWSHLDMTFDGEALTLSVNGGEVARWTPKPEEMPVRPKRDTGAALLVGDATRGFQGRVDSVRISDIVREDLSRVPEGVRIVPEGTTVRRLTFVPTGGLDTRTHRRPETITLESTVTGKLEVIEIGLMGDIR